MQNPWHSCLLKHTCIAIVLLLQTVSTFLSWQDDLWCKPAWTGVTTRIYTVWDLRVHAPCVSCIFNLASWTNHVLMSCSSMSMRQQKWATKPRTQDSQRMSFCFRLLSLLASGSYAKLFVIVSSIIGVYLVKKEPYRQSSWQANDANSPKQNVLSEIHAIHIFKSLQEFCIVSLPALRAHQGDKEAVVDNK